ncbi:HEPN domain-containing protein [Thermoanaerobacterium thermosaccharolyticum]|uniref:HEPN domain-containing protein n=1 Tax=Thermoanaerobacterium thermosaccharolyticum TaxID=1517 RepID=UPI00177FD43E|nr:HEPN domain-containing protein [Thermoanaerobacterium thermosaccharolyticum]MBE0067965.1 HEPN domain-containing protein [Thermoanaerobacterium thermosaccharolyticum]MBE0227704.1 HEPN domain-containing protein [Thermoanaerobacterium thermosaccharolyticum]
MKENYDEYKQWLNYAEDDFIAAKELLKSRLYNVVCFHSQQSIEKHLKAYLIYNGINPPRVHHLITLIRIISKFSDAFDEFIDDVKTVDMYYIPSRYPDAPIGSLPDGMPNENDAKKALEIAGNIRKRIREIIK